MEHQQTVPQGITDDIPYEPEYPQSTSPSNSSQLLDLVLIRLDTNSGSAKIPNSGRTAGFLLINGIFFSDTIEDYDYGWDQDTPESEIKEHKKKHPKRTAIPSGEYWVELIGGGRFGSKKFPAIKVSNYIGQDTIKGFSGIRIHAGEHSGYTEGCILLALGNASADNQFKSYDALPFDKNKLRDNQGHNKGNIKWTPKRLREELQVRGGKARLTIVRHYQSQAICDRQSLQSFNKKQWELQCLNDLKVYRNDTLRFYHSYPQLFVQPQTSSKPYKPFLPAKSGGKIK